jgi:ABC-2 type transport system ATP-binding protein
MATSLLSIENIKKTYITKEKTIEALKGVTLTINRGEVFALLGVNGAGKTTLSSIIATLNPPTSGDLLKDGTSVYHNVLAYRRTFGFCPQKVNFEKDLTVQEILTFAGRYYLMPKAAIEKRVHELLKQFDLDQYAASSPNILSGGYKQRLLIARALVHNPSLVILDEPTVGLDPHIRRQIWDCIRKLKSQGVSVLLATHYLDEAEQLADRVCILDKGLIRLIDTPASLKAAHNKQSLEDVFLQLIEEQAA